MTNWHTATSFTVQGSSSRTLLWSGLGPSDTVADLVFCLALAQTLELEDGLASRGLALYVEEAAMASSLESTSAI